MLFQYDGKEYLVTIDDNSVRWPQIKIYEYSRNALLFKKHFLWSNLECIQEVLFLNENPDMEDDPELLVKMAQDSLEKFLQREKKRQEKRRIEKIQRNVFEERSIK